MRIHGVLVMVVAAAFAGCFGDKPTEGEVEDPAPVTAAAPTLLLNITVGNQTFRFTSQANASTSSSTATGHASHATANPAAGNATGNATGSSTGNGTISGNATVPEGQAPLNVTFQLGATGLPSGSLRWDLDFGATANATGNASAAGNATGNATAPRSVNGTSLPATADYTYLAAGPHTVRFTLRADNRTTQLEASLRILNGTAIATALSEVPFAAEGTITVGTQGDGFVMSGCGFTDSIDVASHDWDLSTVASVERFVVHMDLGSTNIDSDIFLLDANGEEIGSSADFNQPGLGTGSPTEDFEAIGPFGPGVFTLVVRGCAGFEMEYAISGVATVAA